MPPVDPSSQAHRWHAVTGEDTVAALASSAAGLDAGEAARRLAAHGPNRLPARVITPAWRRFLGQFNNVLIHVLLGAGAITTMLGHWVDAGVIFGVVIINAMVGFLQEGKAERAMEAVRKILSHRALVTRGGRRLDTDAGELVPGDLVYLQSGDRVPADLRLLRVRNLRVDEAVLTGESSPVEKITQPVRDEAVLGDRLCMAYSGTLVTTGQGEGMVVTTGRQTEIGRISELLARVEPLTTPLLRQLTTFGHWLTVGILVLAGLAFVFGILVRDFSIDEMFLAAVGLAVAAIPEGLPAIITISLAVGVQRMARRNAIIRRLPAVETLGSVTVICSDKTGTLTRNEMTLTRIELADASIEVSGAGYSPHGSFLRSGQPADPSLEPGLRRLLEAGVLCNDTSVHLADGVWTVDGDPTEAALVVAGAKAGVDATLLAERYRRDDLIPFESEHRFMATLHHHGEDLATVFVKGAPEVLLPRCTRVSLSRGHESMELDSWLRRVEAIAAAGQRPLAICRKRVPAERRSIQFDHVIDELVLLGLVGIIDPPREEAVAAVARCQEAGIRVKMITGDHVGTARSIAASMGIGDARARTGDELDRLDEPAFREAALDTDVFARVSPEHKLALVGALQARGHVVAMTGDGVNDAPALKRADVGVAMGVKGTEAAKEAAEMVLADDDFSSIADAVEEGRTVYDNIKKAILFILPTNGGEALTILAAIALGRTLPVTAAQILWVNMVTAVTLALALAFEPAEHNVMRRAPRKADEPILSAFMGWRIAFVAGLMVTVVFGLFVFEIERGRPVEEARAVAVNALVILEVFYLFNTRFLYAGVFNRRGLLGNRFALLSVATVLTLQLLFTYTEPMQALFRVAPLDATQWLRIVACAAPVLFLVEAEKAVLRRVGATS
jgi:magnesium-transporting ATPase (P-type)